MNNITILENHFLRKKTYIVGNYVSNGCTSFHIKNMDESCKEWKVPKKYKKQVSEIHSTYDIENNESILYENRFHENYKVRELIASQGIAIDDLVNDKEREVRIVLAIQGYGLDKLIHDKSEQVRRMVACYGTNEHRDILVKDSDWLVRCVVAECGEDYHRDQLVFDHNPSVRSEVVRSGNEGHLLKLMNDSSDMVRCAVAHHKCNLDEYVNDISFRVRMVVASVGGEKYHNILMNDEDSLVRSKVAENCNDEIRWKLMFDEALNPSRTAINRATKEQIEKYITHEKACKSNIEYIQRILK